LTDLGTRPLTGMRQLYPSDMLVEARLTEAIRRAALAYGFEEYDGPVLEPLELFLAKSGSELVLEQSYLFTDRGGRQVVMRPEMTPTLARMIAGDRELHLPARWMSFPVCFRYERPQRGRVREFRQFNCDILGSSDVSADVEVVLVLDRIMRNLGASPDTYSIRFSDRRLAAAVLGGLGVPADLHPQAFRAIDRRSKMEGEAWSEWASSLLGGHTEAVVRFASCGSLEDPWLIGLAGGTPEWEHLRSFEDLLGRAGVASASFDAGIVRGLDYYTGVVFELTDTGGANRRAICGGGRYDNLVGMFGGSPVPGVGFGLGMLTLRLYLETYGLLPPGLAASGAPDAYLAVFSTRERPFAVELAEMLRNAGISVEVDLGGGRMGSQFRNAARRMASFTLVIGPDEAAAHSVTVKDMATGIQERLAADGVVPRLLSGKEALER
jgi:histidyl-tRNA synthetase